MIKFGMTEAYRFLRDNGLEKEAVVIKFGKLQKWKYVTSVRRGLLIETTQKHSMTEAFGKAVYPGMPSSEIASNLNQFTSILQDYRAFVHQQPSVDTNETVDEQAEDESVRFAIEAHLRDFLAKNLGLLESGLKLYEQDGRTGIEFAVTEGRIDILAIDKTNKLVVIELKLSQGRNRVLGQLSYYMAWIDENLGRGMCRGIIVANEITPDLVLAAKRVNGVSLAKYRLEFKLEVVSMGS